MRRKGHSMTVEQATARGVHILRGTKYCKKIEGHTVFNQCEEMGLWRSPWKLLCDGILPPKDESQKFENRILQDIVRFKQQSQFQRHQREKSRTANKRLTVYGGTGSPQSRKTIINESPLQNMQAQSMRKPSIIQPRPVKRLPHHERILGIKELTPKQSEPNVTEHRSQGSIPEYKSDE